MSDDFQRLVEEIEAEAKAEGPPPRRSFGTYGASSPPKPSEWRLRIALPAVILNAAAPPRRLRPSLLAQRRPHPGNLMGRSAGIRRGLCLVPVVYSYGRAVHSDHTCAAQLPLMPFDFRVDAAQALG